MRGKQERRRRAPRPGPSTCPGSSGASWVVLGRRATDLAALPTTHIAHPHIHTPQGPRHVRARRPRARLQAYPPGGPQCRRVRPPPPSGRGRRRRPPALLRAAAHVVQCYHAHHQTPRRAAAAGRIPLAYAPPRRSSRRRRRSSRCEPTAPSGGQGQGRRLAAHGPLAGAARAGRAAAAGGGRSRRDSSSSDRSRRCDGRG